MTPLWWSRNELAHLRIEGERDGSNQNGEGAGQKPERQP